MFPPFSLKTVRWRPLRGEGLEHLTVRAAGGGTRADSVVAGTFEGRHFGAAYRVECDAGWRVRTFAIDTTDGIRLSMRSDGNGAWTDGNGERLRQFDGCIDIDLSGSPFTNTLPIRRLEMTPADGPMTLRIVFVPFDSFEPFVDGQIYTCLEPASRYRYQAEDGTFEAEIAVDRDGFVTDYPTLFERL